MMEVGGVSGGGGGCGGGGRKSNIQVGSKYWDGEAQLGPATKKTCHNLDQTNTSGTAWCIFQCDTLDISAAHE